jgi:hypothetical protein
MLMQRRRRQRFWGNGGCWLATERQQQQPSQPLLRELQLRARRSLFVKGASLGLWFELFFTPF